MSLLEVAARIVTLKSEYNMPFNCVDGMASLIEDVIPENNVMTRSFYNTKKVVKGLELPHQKIDACPDGCMLFWKEDALLDKCKKCGKDRYKKPEGTIVMKGKKSKKGSKRVEKGSKKGTIKPIDLFSSRAKTSKNVCHKKCCRTNEMA